MSYGEKPELKFKAKYLGGYFRYPQAEDNVEVLIFSDRIEIEKLGVKIPYSTMTNLDNKTLEEVNRLDAWFWGGRSPFAIPKTIKLLTIVHFVDEFDRKQTIAFEFNKNDLQKVQTTIDDRMMKSRMENQQTTFDNKNSSLAELNVKGNDFYAARNFDQAIRYYEKSIFIQPNQPVVWSNMGLAFSAMKRYDEAIASFDRSLNIDPTNEKVIGYRKSAEIAQSGRRDNK